MPKPTVLIITANDASDSLVQLSQESKDIQRILNSAPGRAYEVVLIPKASIEDIIEEFKVPNRSIEIFHYAGHADGDAIHLANGEAAANALAEKIRNTGTVKFVFLNGCATQEQVQYFHSAGVPFVLATSQKVGDNKAHWLATQFYQYLTLKRSLLKAWDEVVIDSTKLTKKLFLQPARSAGFQNQTNDLTTLEWGLYNNPNTSGTDYSLPFTIGVHQNAPSLDHTHFLEELMIALEGLDNPELAELKKLSDKIQDGGTVPNNKKIATLLKVLPYTLGVRLRQITAEPDSRSNDYFRELLYDYAFFFETLLLQTFALLAAQIWQNKAKTFSQIPQSLEPIRNFLRQNRSVEAPDAYLEGISNLLEWQSKSQANAFPYADHLMKYLQSKDFQQASDFFFLQKKYFWERIRLQEEETLNNCVLSQQYINKAFPHFAFLVNHKLASVRGINVRNFRHLPKDFNQIENMVSTLVVANAEPESIEGNDMMENKSVLSFYKASPEIGTTSLNLFPFIIDRNVFTGKPNNEVDLYLFVGFYNTPTGSEAYHFASVENPSKIWRLDPKERKISLLHTDEETSLIHEQNHLMANAGEFKKYLSEYHSQFLQLLQA